MTVKFKDYYEVLGVDRSASQDDIRKAFRKKARTAHPDVDKSAGADERFKELNEAHAVLSDADKRKRYDQLGANWDKGQEFTPPPNWGGGGVEFDFGDMAGQEGFSDFFSAIFGARGPSHRHAGHAAPRPRRGRDHEVEIGLTLEEVVRGGSKPIQLSTQSVDDHGRPHTETLNYDVKLPVGLLEGSRIRLAGQGGGGLAGGVSGDLHLIVHLLPHSRFTVEGADLRTTVSVSPWEAALGAEVTVPTLTASLTLKVPAGTQGGQVMRLRGQGLPRNAKDKGDLLVQIRVAVPGELTPEERELFEKLARVSKFRPRNSDAN